MFLGEGTPLGWRARVFPSPQAPHPSPNALFSGGCGVTVSPSLSPLRPSPGTYKRNNFFFFDISAVLRQMSFVAVIHTSTAQGVVMSSDSHSCHSFTLLPLLS